MEKFREFCTERNAKLKMTIGSVGLDYWRRNHLKVPIRREPDNQLKHHMTCGVYRGGAVSLFKRGTYDGRMWYYDFRSSYPGRIHEGVDGKGSFPFPGLCGTADKGTDHLLDYEGICEAEVKMPDLYAPPLGVKTPDKRLIFGVGQMNGWFTNVELRHCIDLGAEVVLGKMTYYPETFRFAADAADELYALKDKYKKEKSPYSDMVKTLMNSGLYGKFGTNFLDMEEMIPESQVDFDSMGNALIEGKPVTGLSVSDVDKPIFTRRYEGEPFPYSFPILSTYVTALARLKLFSSLYGHERHLAYIDTDSAVMTRPCLQEEDKIGGFELQYRCRGGVFVAPKMYMLFTEDNKTICKSKGIRGAMSTEDRFRNAILAGHVSFERFLKIKESMNRGIKAGSVISQGRDVRTVDTKRRWDRPFSMHDWQDSEPHSFVNGIIDP
jgi:hypothetical protein